MQHEQNKGKWKKHEPPIETHWAYAMPLAMMQMCQTVMWQIRLAILDH